MGVQNLRDQIEQAGAMALRAHVGVIESLLRRLCRSGFDIRNMLHRYHPATGREEIVCDHVTVLLVTHVYSEVSITTRYQLYPDGRPEGFPDLKLHA